MQGKWVTYFYLLLLGIGLLLLYWHFKRSSDHFSVTPKLKLQVEQVQVTSQPYYGSRPGAMVTVKLRHQKARTGGEWVLVYVSPEGGSSWHLIQQFPYPPHERFLLYLPDGRHGLFLALVDRHGHQQCVPGPTTPAMCEITVDTTPPVVQLAAQRQGNATQITWKVSDPHLIFPLVLEIRTSGSQTWERLASFFQSQGQHWEKLGKGALQLRLKAVDRFNNHACQHYKLEMSPAYRLRGTPAAGQVLGPGTRLKLEWDVLLRASLLFSRSGGREWQVLKQNLVGSGQMHWSIPAVTTSQACFRLVTRQHHIDSPLFTIDASAPEVTLKGPRFTNQAKVTIQVHAVDRGKAGLAWVDLWYLDQDCHWCKIARTVPQQKQFHDFIFYLHMSDGHYIITANAGDRVGNVSQRSLHLSLTVDTTKPEVCIFLPSGDKALRAGQPLCFSWIAQDHWLAPNSVSLQYRRNNDTHWHLIAPKLPNNANLRWIIPRILAHTNVTFKIKVQDQAGNQGADWICQKIGAPLPRQRRRAMLPLSRTLNKVRRVELPPAPLASKFKFKLPPTLMPKLRSLMQTALQAWRQHDWAKAEQSSKRAIACDRQYWQPYYLLGLVYRRQKKKFEMIIRQFQQAIKLNPKVAAVYNDQGVEYFEITCFEKALQAFQKAVQLAPKNHYYRYNLGVVKFSKTDYQACLRIMNNVRRQHPHIGRIAWYLEEAQRRLRR